MPRSLSWLKRQLALRRGKQAEQRAAAWLEGQGYRLIARNVRFKCGELDLIAWQGGVLCFIEVRSAGSAAWGGAAASVTGPKRQRLVRAAQCFLQQLPEMPQEVRFDVVTLDWSHHPPALSLLPGAFEAGR